jgi:hypothetical protein
LTDDEGPQPVPVTVYYDVPEQPTGGGNSAQNGTSPSAFSAHTPNGTVIQPFAIKSDYGYRGYKVGQSIEWTFEVKGGVPPYALNIDWGDGSNSLLSKVEAGKVTATHRYKKVGTGNHGSYLVKITGTDSQGRQSFLQLFLVIIPAGVPGFVSNTLPAGPKLDSSWLKLLWPAYFVVILMAFSFWLGEREELSEIRHKRLMRKRHT